MTPRRRLSLFLVLFATCIALPAFAQSKGSGASSEASASPDDQKKAQEHFKKARDLYSAGKYPDALQELEVARKLDPKAKDLVMNLGIVNEKLGKYDDAIEWFKTYTDMDDVSPAERAKAESNIRRIEGAKKEAASRTPPTPSSSNSSAPPPPPHGRMDGATIGVGAVAIVGLGAGTTFGVLALTKRPTDFVTGRDGSYADLQDKTDASHTMAIVADVAFGVGVVAAIATLYLYFGRTKDPASTGWATGRVSF
jgi:tetratricopeptide (TPR) repeat protein